MKKVVLIGLILLLTGCGTTEKYDEYDDFGRDILPGDVNYYYTFTGESEHFTFDDGMADYRDDKAYFWIKNLKALTDEPFEVEISVYFNDTFAMLSGFTSEETKVKDTLVTEYGTKIKRDTDGHMYGEITPFLKTRPEDFPNAIKVVAKYCKTEKNCQEETFKLNIEKHT